MPETQDLRKVPIGELTTQQIKSRLHIIGDDVLRVQLELKELLRMETALNEELLKRD